MNRLSFFLHPTIKSVQEAAKKFVGEDFTTRMSSFFAFSFATLLFLSTGCGSKQGEVNGIANTSSNATTEVLTTQSDINTFLSEEADLTNFREVMKNNHSLQTLTQVNSKQIILFAPNNQAFEKLGDAEKEKLLNSKQIIERHEVFKNNLVLHDKKKGDWNGEGKTYSGNPVKVDIENGVISNNKTQARILKQIHLEDGHLLYIVDNILT